MHLDRVAYLSLECEERSFFQFNADIYSLVPINYYSCSTVLYCIRFRHLDLKVCAIEEPTLNIPLKSLTFRLSLQLL